jgi:glycosyltransferase involved in cell wall biosynthesis
MEIEPRILFLDTRPIRRGAQIFVHELKHRFSQEGLTVRRIFLYKETNYEQLPLDETDLVLQFRDNHIFEKIPTVQPQLVRDLAREIKKFSPNLILCNGSRTLKYAAVVKKCYPSIKAKWVYRVIDSAKYWNKRVFTKYCYKHFVIPSMDGAVGVSQKSLDEMIHHYGFKKPSVCIPRAIDIGYFANFLSEDGAREKIGIPNDAFVLLFLGNFTRQKRPDRFIDIIQALQKDLPLVYGLMVGDGPLKNDSFQQVEKLGLNRKIIFVGYQQDVRPWISMSDILLLTSDTEGMPGVVLEAGAMKKSTISNDIGGIKEIISDQTNGFVVLNGEVNKFISYIKLLTRNNELKKNFENNIFDFVHERNNMETIFVTYKHFLNQIRFGI